MRQLNGTGPCATSSSRSGWRLRTAMSESARTRSRSGSLPRCTAWRSKLADGEAVLRRCFAAVFPELPRDEIEQASIDTVAEWDSLASVTLLALLEEAFGIQISDLDLPDLRSFSSVRDYLRREQVLQGDESTAALGED